MADIFAADIFAADIFADILNYILDLDRIIIF